ncbi:ribosomal S17-domain-containing protein [Pholiota molesta]|nr:ribosomal S17-domain-containing protein [Pholiota molesta]
MPSVSVGAGGDSGAGRVARVFTGTRSRSDEPGVDSAVVHAEGFSRPPRTHVFLTLRLWLPYANGNVRKSMTSTQSSTNPARSLCSCPVDARRHNPRWCTRRLSSLEVEMLTVAAGTAYPRLTLDFHTNKRIIDEVAVVPSKRLRNKISGFTTHPMKRIQRGLVRGISFKLQEDERERKDNYVPEVSALDTSATGLEVDPDTKALLESLNFDSIQVNVITPVLAVPERGQRRERRAVPGAGRS